MVYIPATDAAWDQERIERELAAINGDRKVLRIAEDDATAAAETIPWATEAEHPIKRYGSGASRFDLSTVRDYLLPGIKPAEFTLRRAPIRVWEEIRGELSDGRIPQAARIAMTHSLVSVDVEGLDVELRRHKANNALYESVIEEIRERLGDHEYNMLGFACINANAALMDDEKKA